MRTSPSRERSVPELPALSPGIQLLTADSENLRAIHALTVDHVLLSGGTACWIDPGTSVRSAQFVELAPSDRILDRVHLARGFTPFQHLALLEALPEFLTDRTEIVVVPELDGYYRNDELLAEEGRDMLLRGLAVLARIVREYRLPVLITRTVDDEFGRPIENAAARRLYCRSTPFGVRFWTDDADTDHETLAYPIADGAVVQTTLAFWERVLAARTPLYEAAHPEVTVRGTN